VKRDLGDGYELDDDPARIDRDAVHAYLGTDAYWAAGRTREEQDALIDGSVRVVGLYRDGRQVGFARASEFDAAASSTSRRLRPRRVPRARLRRRARPRDDRERAVRDRRWILHTRDAHGLYARFGFEPNERLVERGAVKG
jgi:hypothetical protein